MASRSGSGSSPAASNRVDAQALPARKLFARQILQCCVPVKGRLFRLLPSASGAQRSGSASLGSSGGGGGGGGASSSVEPAAADGGVFVSRVILQGVVVGVAQASALSLDDGTGVVVVRTDFVKDDPVLGRGPRVLALGDYVEVIGVMKVVGGGVSVVAITIDVAKPAGTPLFRDVAVSSTMLEALWWMQVADCNR